MLIRRAKLKEVDVDNEVNGYIEFVCKNNGTKNVAQKTLTKGGSKLSAPSYLNDDGIPCFYLVHIGGGYVQKESYENHISILKDAKCILTTQASTQIYKTLVNDFATQSTQIYLEDGSLLEFLQNNLILFKDSLYKQDVRINMHKGASLIYTDGITAGYSDDGKPFSYNEAFLKTSIYVDSNPILLDNFILKPRENDFYALGFFEGYTHFGSFVAINPSIDSKCISDIEDLLKEQKLDVKLGVSRFYAHGFAIRILANATQDIDKIVKIAHDYLRVNIFNLKPLDVRKY